MDARKEDPIDVKKEESKTIIAIDTSTSIYFAALRKLYEPSAEFFTRPNAAIALHTLLQRYINRQAEPICYLFSRSLNHVAFAKTCQEKLKNSTSDEVVQVLKDINGIKDMTEGGDFSCMLVTFLNVFPDYVKHCEHQAIRNSMGQDFWKNSTSEWLNRFKELHAARQDSDDHEQLERIAAIVPEEMASNFADFLLSQLTVTDRPEANREGLYRGWVCVALSKLESKLSPSKKQAVSDELATKYLSKKSNNFMLIGLCLALSRLSQDKTTLQTTAAQLHGYATSQLPALQDTFTSTVNTVSSYMPNIFVALHELEKYFSTVTKKSIMRLIVESGNIYPYRAGISELHQWIEQPELNEELNLLFNSMLEHEKFDALLPQFWGWLSHTKGALALHDKYLDSLDKASKALKAPDNFTTIRESLALFNTYKEAAPKDKNAIAIGIARALDPGYKGKLSAKKRAEILSVLPIIQAWFSEAHKQITVKIIMDTLKLPGNENQVITNGAKALFAYSASPSTHVTAPDTKYYRDVLLCDLGNDAAQETGSALKFYASFADMNKLPDFLMCLSSIADTNTTAKLLLEEVHQIYSAKLSAQVKLASESKQQEAPKVAP